MPKLPVVSGRDMLRVLERRGWVFDRQTGSHVIMADPTTGVTVSVPVHGSRDMTPGSVRAIIGAVGLSVEEFRRLLK